MMELTNTKIEALLYGGEKVEIEVKYKFAVTVMELRFWLKDCESPI